MLAACYLYDRGRRALNCGGPTKIPVLRTCAQELIPVTRAFVRAGAVPSMESIPTARLTYQPSLSMLFLHFSAAYQSEDTDDTNDYCTPSTTPSSNGEAKFVTMQLVVAALPNPGPMHPLTTNGTPGGSSI
jgi:hypothetical protein